MLRRIRLPLFRSRSEEDPTSRESRNRSKMTRTGLRSAAAVSAAIGDWAKMSAIGPSNGPLIQIKPTTGLE